jgi:hypothetical protein
MRSNNIKTLRLHNANLLDKREIHLYTSALKMVKTSKQLVNSAKTQIFVIFQQIHLQHILEAIKDIRESGRVQK